MGHADVSHFATPREAAMTSAKTLDFWIEVAAGLLAGTALWIALQLRVTGVDQPYLMLITQEVLLGRHAGLLDLPASTYIHATPVLAFHWLGWPMVFTWNLFIAILCAISAGVFALRINTERRGVVWCLWFAAAMLLFDDTNIGQREYFFALLWFPYLAARFAKPTRGHAALDVLCGALLSIAICAKFYFALFVLAVDIPLLLLGRRVPQSYASFWAMVAGGLVQTAIFFLTYHVDRALIADRFGSYYGTIGVDHLAVVHYLLRAPSIYVALAAIALAIDLNWRTRRPIGYALACGGSAIVCLFLGIMQGGPRPYNYLPLFMGSVACLLQAAFSESAAIPSGEPTAAPAFWLRHTLIAGALVAVVWAVGEGDSGLMRAFFMRYLWNQADYARIGPVPEDEYMAWVRKHVADNEEIYVIALQYGGTSAFDPILSTIRLGRRVNSANPILQFPLRAALVSGDARKIDAAWGALIDEIATARPTWIVTRRTTPSPMAPDFIKIVETAPRFHAWLIANYESHSEFGPYVAFRLRGESKT
jgi:hypothetical protein